MSVRTRFDIAPLHLSYDEDLGWLDAVEFGLAIDGVDPALWRPVDERFAYLLRGPGDVEAGFRVHDLAALEPEEHLPQVFGGPRFDVPALGLAGATAGEILLAARTFLEGRSTVNRLLFDAAIGAQGEEAVVAWRRVLETGDVMGHYGLGYTLLDLGEPHLAYRHLRYYSELLPEQAWAWCFRGRAAQRLGDDAEAADCYRRAIALDERGDPDDATTAADDLRALLGGG